MGHWLATARTVQDESVLTRFDPMYWTVDFPRPMMAAVTTIAADALRPTSVECRDNPRATSAKLRWAKT